MRAPEFGYQQQALLEDIAIFTGGTVVSHQKGYRIEHTTLDQLGSDNKIILDKSYTTLVESYGSSNQVNARMSQIRNQLRNAVTEEERTVLMDSLMNLASGAAIISVGGNSLQDMTSRKKQVEKALKATKTAITQGVVPGSGVSYIRLQQVLDKIKGHYPEFVPAFELIHAALETPLRAIAENADSDIETVVKKVQSGQKGYGYNALTRTYEDLFAAGIMDSAGVTRSALESAIQTAGLVLTTSTCISVMDPLA